MNIDGVLSGLANRSFVAVIRDLQDLGVFFVHRVGDRKARRTASGLSGIASSILEQSENDYYEEKSESSSESLAKLSLAMNKGLITCCIG